VLREALDRQGVPERLVQVDRLELLGRQGSRVHRANLAYLAHLGQAAFKEDKDLPDRPVLKGRQGLVVHLEVLEYLELADHRGQLDRPEW